MVPPPSNQAKTQILDIKDVDPIKVYHSEFTRFKPNTQETVSDTKNTPFCHNPKNPPKFQNLAPEILILISIHLDPISLLTLSLTCHSLHAAYHSLLLSFTFPPPRSLDMQISTCGLYTLNCGLEDWFYRDSMDITWDPPLLDLLAKERIWDGLKYCEGCGKFKPENSFDETAFEREAYARNPSRVARVAIQDWYNHWENCRRCRAWTVLVFEGAEEFVDPDREFWEEPLVLGLKLPGKRKREMSRLMIDSLNKQDYHAYLNHYERKKDVFQKLRI